MTTVVLALLDKGWPPNHSFVDGMLATEAAREADISMRLFVSRTSGATGASVRRYLDTVCFAKLFPRRGLGRLLNLFLTIGLIRYQAQRERRRGRRVVIFVRNDPAFLLAASLVHQNVDRVVFQSSFPHEQYTGHVVKRCFATVLYQLAAHGTDVVTGVSPEGVARIQRLFPTAKAGKYIPLLVDMPVAIQEFSRRIDPNVGPVFVYVGTHGPERELEMVLASIVQAVAQGVKAQFRFVGATNQDQHRLRQVKGIDELIRRGVLRLEPLVSRQEVLEILSVCDVGLSLIPAKPIYCESSPTKLAEYMGAGLAVLASRGIPMQERFVADSNGGVLVDWGVSSIAEGISAVCQDYSAVSVYRENAAIFARRSLQYQSYLPAFRSLLGLA